MLRMFAPIIWSPAHFLLLDWALTTDWLIDWSIEEEKVAQIYHDML